MDRRTLSAASSLSVYKTLITVPLSCLLFGVPVSTNTKIESVATSYKSERKDYSDSEGARLLAHVSNSRNDNNESLFLLPAGHKNLETKKAQ